MKDEEERLRREEEEKERQLEEVRRAKEERERETGVKEDVEEVAKFMHICVPKLKLTKSCS